MAYCVADFRHVLFMGAVFALLSARYMLPGPAGPALLNRAYNSLKWCLNSPPKPHPFVSLPLQSGLDFPNFKEDHVIRKCTDIIVHKGEEAEDKTYESLEDQSVRLLLNILRLYFPLDINIPKRGDPAHRVGFVLGCEYRSKTAPGLTKKAKRPDLRVDILLDKNADNDLVPYIFAEVKVSSVTLSVALNQLCASIATIDLHGEKEYVYGIILRGRKISFYKLMLDNKKKLTPYSLILDMKEIKYELSSVEKVKLKEPGMENTILAYE
jgi:hypothetical protein